MGTLVFWLGVGPLLALVLLAARVVDRRDRRRGHYLHRSSWTACSRPDTSGTERTATVTDVWPMT
jgi:hypothetical protein